jgi:hypothetical protein
MPAIKFGAGRAAAARSLGRPVLAAARTTGDDVPDRRRRGVHARVAASLSMPPKLLGTTDGYLPTTEGRLQWQS